MERDITVLVNGERLECSQGNTITEIIGSKNNDKSFIGAIVNNEVKSLNFKITEDSDIKLLTYKDVDGYRIYTKTLTAIFIKACKDVFPNRNPKMEHFLGSALYCTLEGNDFASFEDIRKIENRMKEIISEDITIEKIKMSKEDIINFFEEQGEYDKSKLLSSTNITKNHIIRIGDHYDMYEGVLAPSTSYIKNFSLKYYYPGLLINFPSFKNNYDSNVYVEHPSLSKVFSESTKWAEILDLAYVGSLNMKIIENDGYETIRINESLHEKKISKIADIVSQDDDYKVIMISGPSSSGKTTFANRLQTSLKVNGRNTYVISTDNYFVDREKTPLDENGNYDFEALEAMDLKSLSADIISLMEGRPVKLRKFDFFTGKSIEDKEYTKISDNELIIVEGIHSLNPAVLSEIPQKCKFKIYISALTQLNMDAHNRISTTDTRLIRRLVRDSLYRGYPAQQTLSRWQSVRNGEEKHIFPFQEEADIMFDSALVYEMAVLKKHAIPLLKTIKPDDPNYIEASKLIRFLSYFRDINDESQIPPNSLLREFLPEVK